MYINQNIKQLFCEFLHTYVNIQYYDLITNNAHFATNSDSLRTSKY